MLRRIFTGGSNSPVSNTLKAMYSTINDPSLNGSQNEEKLVVGGTVIGAFGQKAGCVYVPESWVKVDEQQKDVDACTKRLTGLLSKEEDINKER